MNSNSSLPSPPPPFIINPSILFPALQYNYEQNLITLIDRLSKPILDQFQDQYRLIEIKVKEYKRKKKYDGGTGRRRSRDEQQQQEEEEDEDEKELTSLLPFIQKQFVEHLKRPIWSAEDLINIFTVRFTALKEVVSELTFISHHLMSCLKNIPPPSHELGPTTQCNLGVFLLTLMEDLQVQFSYTPHWFNLNVDFETRYQSIQKSLAIIKERIVLRVRNAGVTLFLSCRWEWRAETLNSFDYISKYDPLPPAAAPSSFINNNNNSKNTRRSYFGGGGRNYNQEEQEDDQDQEQNEEEEDQEEYYNNKGKYSNNNRSYSKRNNKTNNRNSSISSVNENTLIVNEEKYYKLQEQQTKWLGQTLNKATLLQIEKLHQIIDLNQNIVDNSHSLMKQIGSVQDLLNKIYISTHNNQSTSMKQLEIVKESNSILENLSNKQEDEIQLLGDISQNQLQQNEILMNNQNEMDHKVNWESLSVLMKKNVEEQKQFREGITTWNTKQQQAQDKFYQAQFQQQQQLNKQLTQYMNTIQELIQTINNKNNFISKKTETVVVGGNSSLDSKKPTTSIIPPFSSINKPAVIVAQPKKADSPTEPPSTRRSSIFSAEEPELFSKQINNLEPGSVIIENNLLSSRASFFEQEEKEEKEAEEQKKKETNLQISTQEELEQEEEEQEEQEEEEEKE